MLKRTIIGALAATTALSAIPTAAEAQYYRDGYYGRNYSRYPRHRTRTSVYINVGSGYGGYYDPYYGGYYGPSYGAYYGPSYYDYYAPRYYRSYYRPRYYRDRYYGCDNGTSGAIVGGAAGALVGSEIGRDGRRYRYRYGRRGGSTSGAIIGGAIGALIGSEASRC
jgi:hypothetical protein